MSAPLSREHVLAITENLAKLCNILRKDALNQRAFIESLVEASDVQNEVLRDINRRVDALAEDIGETGFEIPFPTDPGTFH